MAYTLRATMTVEAVLPQRMNSTPMNTRPGMVWKMDSTGKMMPDHFGTRDSRIPSSRPRQKPQATETSTYTVWMPMAFASMAP